MNLTNIARSLFTGALQALDVPSVMRDRVQCVGRTLHLGDLAYPLEAFRRVLVVAIGKAAAPMSDGLLRALEPALRIDQSIAGLVIGATAPEYQDGRLSFFRGSHPLPDQGARAAAEAVLALLETADESCLVIFLISGGASAMLEWALDDGMSVEDEVGFHRALVLSGLPIAQMNALRKHFSRVKGGRLAVAASRATQCTLLISDVPEDMLDVVGSGPSLHDPSTIADCLQIIEASRASLHLSPKLLEFFLSERLVETPKAGDPAFRSARWMSLLSSDDLWATAGRAAAEEGFFVVVDNTCDDLDYRRAAGYLVGRLEELRGEHPRVCLLSAGEVSVPVALVHGVGGRNQQFALECGRLLAERGLQAVVLSGGSDGVDGNSPAAGAVADETTFGRARALGLDAAAALAGFDCFPLFEALGDAIVTGPTGNNVRDLRILLSERF